MSVYDRELELGLVGELSKLSEPHELFTLGMVWCVAYWFLAESAGWMTCHRVAGPWQKSKGCQVHLVGVTELSQGQGLSRQH